MLSSPAQQVNQLDSFFGQIVQDTALYPGSPSMDRAVADHIFIEDGTKERMVGSFLYPVDRFREMQNQFPLAGGCDTALLGSDPARLDKTCLTAVEDERLRATHIELVLQDEDSDDFGVISYKSRHFPCSAVFVEVPRRVDLGLIFGQFAFKGYGAKMCTGGLSAETFPSEEAAATLVVESSKRSLPIKFNARLHRAVRRRNHVTGFDHRGFLNVAVAVCQIVSGEKLSQCIETLGQKKFCNLVETLRELAPKAQAVVRALFVGFGSCGINQPYQESLKLVLLEEVNGK